MKTDVPIGSWVRMRRNNNWDYAKVLNDPEHGIVYELTGMLPPVGAIVYQCVWKKDGDGEFLAQRKIIRMDNKYQPNYQRTASDEPRSNS